MLKLSTVVISLLLASAASANPYVQGLWTKGNPIYTTAGETFTPKTLTPDAAVTSVAFAYHPLSAGSFWDIPAVASHEPDWIKPILPRESWACSLGGAFGATKTGVVGCGVNLLDSVRQEASQILEQSNNASLNKLGQQIAPGNGPVSLYASRVEQFQFNASGRIVAVPRWMFAASYGF